MNDVAFESPDALVLHCDSSTKNEFIAMETKVSSKIGQCTHETPKKSGINVSKNSSLEEDLLGANSLLMSDTDDENGTHEPAEIDRLYQFSCKETEEIQITLKTKDAVSNPKNCEQTKNMNHKSDAASISPTANNHDNKSKNGKFTMPFVSSSEEKNVSQKKKKKFSAILDSDSDESGYERNSTSKPTVAKPKFSTLIDTDSDVDEEEKLAPEQLKINRKLKLIDSDSDENEKPTDINSRKKSKKRHPRKPKSKDFNTESDVQLNSDVKFSETREVGTLNSGDEEIPHQVEDNTEEQAINSMKKPMRVSAKKALDDIQAIQSEQQRLHREAHISVPYHKPKRHTLQEFLKRRTIIKPAAECECSPAAAILKQKSLKMTPGELEEYAKLMEERAKEAKEFFKSESESDEDEFKTKTGAIDEDQQIAENTENMENSKQCSDRDKTEARIPLDDEQMDVLASKTTNTEEQDNSEVDASIPQTSSQAFVTEVLELPNIDLSTLHFNEKDDNTPVSILIPSTANPSMLADGDVPDLKQQTLDEKILTDSPTIKGDSNMIIDLESGDLIEKKPTGADNLLQRLLATNRARRAKTSETVNILSNENGKFEITRVSVPLHDDDAVIKEQKPGAAYVKLKENLKTLIKKKRLEEKQKKQEDENEYNKCLEGDGYDDEEEDEIENDFELDGKMSRRSNRKFDEIVIDDEENTLNDCDDNNYMEEEADEDGPAELYGDNEKEDEDNEVGIIEKDSDSVGGGDYDEIEATEEPSIHNRTEQNDDTDKDSSDSDDDNEKLKNFEFNMPSGDIQRKSRIIKAFTDDSDADGNNNGNDDGDDDDDDDMGLLKTQVTIVPTNLPNQLFGIKDSPMKSCMSLPCSDIGVCNTQELLSLCSGTFDATQNPSISEASTIIISQIPITQRSHDMSDELLGLCSGTFDGNSENQQSEYVKTATPDLDEDKNVKEKVEGAAFKILSSDEEDQDSKTEENRRKRVKKLRKKLKKRQVKLGFSDDEDENDPASQISTANDDIDGMELDNDNDVENEVDMPETFIEYDSEENEIVVEMTKKDCIKRAENFFENEAELSESDWGSADEDEKNMDEYDIELGDEDEFDKGKLQQELGQIHARKVLDDDIREVRKIQELLFEDEETDGVGRQRQFRWKNAENGFSLDDMRDGGEDGINEESGDEEQKQEHLWRKIRFERDQLLKEQGLKESSQEFVTTTLGLNSPLTAIIANSTSIRKNTTPILGSNGKRFQIITKKTTSTVSAKRNGSPFLISSNSTVTRQAAIAGAGATPPTSSLLQPKVARGSFLTRDKETLTKFANLTKSRSTNGYDDEETAGTVSVKSKNFVFATLTKEEHEHLKRKADDLMNSSTETGTNFMKKPRKNTVDKQCLIDQLLM